MLKNIYIKNFAIVDEESIDFSNGFNILTGETGSGKSIVVDALALLAGGRVNKSLIGKRENYSIVEGYFSCNFSDEDFDKLNIEPCEEVIVTRRFTENSSSIKINNRVSNLSILQEFSKKLIDVYGQNSQSILTNKNNYLGILDSFGGKDLELKEIQKLNRELRDKNKELKKFSLSKEEIIREEDLINYQIEEIESFNFNIDEEKLDNEFKRLNNGIELINLSNESLEILNGDNNFNNIHQSFTNVLSNLRDISNYDSTMVDFYERVNSTYIELEDQIKDLEHYRDKIEVDPERLEEIDKIFKDLFNLKNKYGRNKEEILSYLDELNKKLNELSNYQEEKKKILIEIDEIEKKLEQNAKGLSKKRKKNAKAFESSIISELKDLNIKNIEFEIIFDKSEKISDTGFDIVDFMITTNIGEAKKSLSMVGSGGEMSRFMLAFKSVVADIDEVNTLVFDEIDTGISGRTAQVVAEKLYDISKKHQIIVISHLPQIASLADKHLLISKYIESNSTFSKVDVLDKEGRVEEIARLIGGVNITEKTRSSAKENLIMAQKIKEK